MLATGTWPGFVARVATPAIPAELAELIAESYEAVIGGECPGGVLLCVLAQILLETGTREDPNHDGVTTLAEQAPGFWNGNPGNVRGTYGAPGWWTSFTAGEGHGKSAVTLEPGPQNKFRSYVGPDEDASDPETRKRVLRRGVDDMLALLSRRYQAALDAAARGDFRGYVHALRDKGYFTADELTYYNAESRIEHTVEHLPQIAAYLHEVIAA
jgi:hypothetical protein